MGLSSGPMETGGVSQHLENPGVDTGLDLLRHHKRLSDLAKVILGNEPLQDWHQGARARSFPGNARKRQRDNNEKVGCASIPRLV